MTLVEEEHALDFEKGSRFYNFFCTTDTAIAGQKRKDLHAKEMETILELEHHTMVVRQMCTRLKSLQLSHARVAGGG